MKSVTVQLNAIALFTLFINSDVTASVPVKSALDAQKTTITKAKTIRNVEIMTIFFFTPAYNNIITSRDVGEPTRVGRFCRETRNRCQSWPHSRVHSGQCTVPRDYYEKRRFASAVRT